MILREFGDDILKMMTVTGLRKEKCRSARSTWEGKEHSRKDFTLISRSERAVHMWLMVDEKLSLGVCLESWFSESMSFT